MAAIAVPIVAAVLPTVIPFVVKLLDKIFPDKSGPTKADVATEILAAIQQGLQNTKALNGQPLTGDQLRTAIETVVAQLNAAGTLKGSATVLDQAPQALAPMADLLIYIGNAMKGAK